MPLVVPLFLQANPLIQMLVLESDKICQGPSKLEPFIVMGGAKDVNVTALVHMFCTIDYNVLLQELNEPNAQAMTIIAKVVSYYLWYMGCHFIVTFVAKN